MKTRATGVCGVCCRFLTACVLGYSAFPAVGPAGWAAAPGREWTGMDVAGHVIVGTLRELVPGKHLVFQHGEQRSDVAWNDLVWWGSFHDRYQGTQLMLANGSRIVADILRIESEQVVIGGRLWSETAIPLSAVRAIVFRCSAGCLRRDLLFDRVTSLVSERDRLILENGDELVGRLVQPVRPEAGAFNPTAVSWQIQADQPAARVSLRRTVAIVFHRAAASTPMPTPDVVRIGFRDGSCLHVSQVAVTSGTLVVQLGGTVRLRSESAASGSPWDDVVFVQPIKTSIVYLSDLTPLGYKHIPYFDVTWPYRTDRGVAGGLLRHRGQVFFKGLGLHSSARLAYDLKKPYRWLQAELALDDQAGNDGSVVFRVYVQDARAQWRLAYESPVVRGGQRAIPMRVDVRAAKRLALIVDFADRADTRDHADWLNARLVP